MSEVVYRSEVRIERVKRPVPDFRLVQEYSGVTDR
jgi:hypothetical protein